MARKFFVTRRDFVRAPQTTFTGGSWSLPLANLQDHNLGYPAVANNNEPSSTWFRCDLGLQRKVGIFFFQNLRLTVNATLRFRAGLSSTFSTTTFDTGTIAAWPVDSDPATYGPWGEFTLTGAYNADEYALLGMPRYFVPPSPIAVRYIRLDVEDTTAAEPLQIGVFGAAEIWEPPRNFSYNRSVAIIDGSEVTRVPGGSVFIKRRRIFQRQSYGVGFLPSDEMWRRSFDVVLTKGKSEPIVVVPDPDDTRNLEKQAIYGLISADPEFTNPFFGLWSMTFQVDQL